MCAVARCAAIGIDVERLRPWHELADMASLVGESSPGDAQGLLALWTRKEAIAKALGTGLPDDVRTLKTPKNPPETGEWVRERERLWIGCPCVEGCVASLVLGQPGPDARGMVGITETRSDEPGLRGWSIALRH